MDQPLKAGFAALGGAVLTAIATLVSGAEDVTLAAIGQLILPTLLGGVGGLSLLVGWNVFVEPARNAKSLKQQLSRLEGQSDQQQLVDELARLRDNAVHLFAAWVETDSVLVQWIEKVRTWEASVTPFLTDKFSLADALRFTGLVEVAIKPYAHALNPAHRHELSMLFARTEILAEIIKEQRP